MNERSPHAPPSSSHSRRPRIGFLGVGWIGRHRMEALVRSGMITAVAAADSAPEARQKAEQIAPGIAMVDDVAALLKLDLDGIVIATPSALHAEQAIAALNAGVAVFCQKPLGRTACEVRRIVAAAAESDKLLGVDLSYRFLAGARTIKTLVQTGAIGEVYAVSATFHNAYGPDKPWFYDPALAGGGCVMDLRDPPVDLVLWVLGFPRVTNVCSKLFLEGKPLTDGADVVEDYAFAHGDLSTGAHVSLDCSWRLSAGCDAVIRAAFYGKDGGLSLQNVNGSFYDFVAEQFRGTKGKILHAPPDDWGGRAALAWAHRLAEGNSYDPENEQLIAVAEVLDAIYRREKTALQSDSGQRSEKALNPEL